MAAAAKLKPPDPTPLDFARPIRLRNWRLPRGEFVGTTNIESFSVLPVASHIKDGFGVEGIVEVIELQPNGVVAVTLRCGKSGATPEGYMETLFFTGGGQGAPL